MSRFTRNMTLLMLAVLLTVTTTTRSSAIPQPEQKIRVIDKPLSDELHFDEDTQEHNRDYDHEAFLGKEEVQNFDHLSTDESKQRLEIIYGKIDKDGNGLVTEEELTDWIKYVQTRYIRQDTERQWKDHQLEPNAKLTWDAYKQRTYSNIDEDINEEDVKEEGYNYRDMMRRDKRRWSLADRDGDGALSKDEFTDFLHPEESEHMKDIIVDETLEDIDKDKDGKISLEEYIGDMWPNAETDEDMPEWVATEQEQFGTFRDQNKDGFMDRNEVQHWIIPQDYDHTKAESKHLMYEADINRDGTLTLQEVLDKYDVFVGSQATDFGEALRKHDEF